MTDQLEMSDPVRGEDGKVEWSIRSEKDGVGVVTDVAVDADAARAWALQLLTAAGPDTDELVQTWIAGAVRLTIEAPKDCAVLADPMISARPQSAEEFERVVQVLGGLASFSEYKPESLHGRDTLSMSVPPLDAAHRETLFISLGIPAAVKGDLPSIPDGLLALAKRQQDEREQQIAEQAAADALVGEIVMQRDREGVVFDTLKTGGPATQGELASLLPSLEADLGNTLTNLTTAGCVRVNHVDGDGDPEFACVPGWRPVYDGEGGAGALGFHQDEDASGALSRALGPGPGKDHLSDGV